MVENAIYCFAAAAAYRLPGQQLDFTRMVMMEGIQPAENVLLMYARKSKLALLLDVACLRPCPEATRFSTHGAV